MTREVISWLNSFATIRDFCSEHVHTAKLYELHEDADHALRTVEVHENKVQAFDVVKQRIENATFTGAADKPEVVNQYLSFRTYLRNCVFQFCKHQAPEAEVKEIADGVFFGTHVWEDGSTYEGEFRADRGRYAYHGRGLMQYADGWIYDGMWKDGLKHGDGVMRLPGVVEHTDTWEADIRRGVTSALAEKPKFTPVMVPTVQALDSKVPAQRPVVGIRNEAERRRKAREEARESLLNDSRQRRMAQEEEQRRRMAKEEERRRRMAKEEEEDSDGSDVSLSPYKIFEHYGGGGGGCYKAQTLIELPGRTSKMVQDLRVGDLVATADDGAPAPIEAILTQAEGAMRELVQLPSGLLISRPHRVRWNGVWCKPEEIPGAAIVQSDCALYNIAVHGRGAVFADGIVASTIGQYCPGAHDLMKARHALWGSEHIIDLLKTNSSWPYVRLAALSSVLRLLKSDAFASQYLRDAETGKAACARAVGFDAARVPLPQNVPNGSARNILAHHAHLLSVDSG